MTQPLASIVIASYNYAPFLAQAIDSALSQTCPRVETIVIDDGSTDDSRAVIDAYHDRVTAIFKPNGGQASVWNAGFRASHGEFVVFLDADDVLHRSALERIARAMADPGVAKVHWQLTVIDERGDATGQLMPPQQVSEGDLRSYVVQSGPGGHPGHVWPPSSGNAWAHTFLDHVLPIPESAFRVSPDLYLTVLAPLYGRVRRLPEPQASWRVHGRNHTWRLPFDDRLNAAIRLWEASAAGLQEHCRRQSLPADIDRWRERGWYHRIRRALVEISRVVPTRATFVLADEAQWDTDALVEERRRLPFVERDGQYWGPPADDAAAIRELERLRRAGADFFVLGWPAFWWLEHYRGFAAYLHRAFDRVLDTERLVVFDLRRPPPSGATERSLA